jgi:hypothetical protein
MEDLIPFCDICGDPRVMASGTHARDEGHVRWAMYGCGHTRSRLMLDVPEVEPAGADPLHLAS